MSDDIALNPKQLTTALTAAVESRLRVLIKGAPGIGKTFIEEQVAASLGADNVVMHPSVDDPTDYKGYPWMVNGKATHVPFGKLQLLEDAKKLTVCFIDDLGQGSTAVQAAVMQMLDRYRTNEHVVFVAATNERSHRAGVTGILEPVKSRFDSIIRLVAHFPSWKTWAEDHMIDYRIIGFLSEPTYQPLLHKFEPSVDIVNQPCPRTWNSASRVLGLDIPDEDVRFAMLAGAVGQAAATTLVAWLKIAETAPSREEVIADPKKTRIPEESSALYAISAALASGFQKGEFPAISIYAQRMYAAEQGEFCAMFLRDIFRKSPDLKNTPEFRQLATTPLAKLVMEAYRFNKEEGK